MTSEAKATYNKARNRALRDLARNHPEEYERLMEGHLARPLNEHGRTLTQRLHSRTLPKRLSDR